MKLSDWDDSDVSWGHLSVQTKSIAAFIWLPET
jgi:hypothetical protein